MKNIVFGMVMFAVKNYDMILAGVAFALWATILLLVGMSV